MPIGNEDITHKHELVKDLFAEIIHIAKDATTMVFCRTVSSEKNPLS